MVVGRSDAVYGDGSAGGDKLYAPGEAEMAHNVSRRIIDGDLESCATTASILHPWAEVSLGERNKFSVGKVVVYGHASTLHGAHVFVGPRYCGTVDFSAEHGQVGTHCSK